MKKLAIILLSLTFAVASIFIYSELYSKQDESKKMENSETPETEDKWKEKLTEEEYRVLREKGTERAWTGEYNMHFEEGVYKCAGCGETLFTSDTKFDSHCGWPSFYDVSDNEKVKEVEDRSHGMVRTEVVCANCGGHLGHVFEDGPNPTGLRYCINSVSLDFEPDSNDKNDSNE